jgi:DNA invertase Pin-like site-specific DNA recombinase
MRKYIIALYIRLSVEDYKTESLSIRNQRIYLMNHAMTLPEYDDAEILEFTDNGHSGANFERPAVQGLLDMVRAGHVNCILVKDFSRFGRNSIETGYFIERVFPVFHTRFISVGDDFDSADFKGDTGGLNVAFKYLISEWYSRDMSMKTKTAKYAKMRRGEYQSKICLYGYQKSADGRLEPDPEAAPVVREIFDLAAAGLSSAAIARKLHERGIPTPGEYKVRKGTAAYDISRTGGAWPASTVLRILEDERYVGTYIIGKRVVTEIGGHKVRRKDESEWYKIPGHHPAIVEQALFEQVQATGRRPSQYGRKTREYLLRGKVVCGLCGHALTRASH